MSHRSSSLGLEELELALPFGMEVVRKELEELAWLEFPAHRRCKSKSLARHPFRYGQDVRRVQVDLYKIN
jgi:hypothetical protein